MDAILKKVMEAVVPHLIDFALDNRQVLIDFLQEEAKKTDNSIDDFVVEVLEDYINGL